LQGATLRDTLCSTAYQENKREITCKVHFYAIG
jgi:hypothetical protein